jgi:S-formylglutathione hydrolase
MCSTGNKGDFMFYIIVILAGIFAMPAKGLDGTLVETTVPSANVPGPVAITYYLPKNYDAKRAEPYPLLIQLHGGGLSNKAMGDPTYGGGGWLLDQAIENGLVAPMVSVMTSAGRWEYMNFKDGSQRWEDFIMKDLLTYMRKNFNVSQGRQGIFVTGASMGGSGSLRMAIKYPEVFQAVASLEPGVPPALVYDDITLRDRWYPDDIKQIYKQIYGDPIDKDYWAAYNPATIIKRDPSRLLGLAVYLEVGDQDMYYLDQGTEFVHRVLFDAGISHEYRLVKGADHIGPSRASRFFDVLAFVGRQINPPNWIDDTVLRSFGTMDQMDRATESRQEKRHLHCDRR